MTLTTLLKCTSSCLLDELIGNLRRQAYLRSKDIKQSRFSLHSFELTINFQSDQEVLSSFFMKISEMILTICWKDFSQEKFNERVLTTATTTTTTEKKTQIQNMLSPTHSSNMYPSIRAAHVIRTAHDITISCVIRCYFCSSFLLIHEINLCISFSSLHLSLSLFRVYV